MQLGRNALTLQATIDMYVVPLVVDKKLLNENFAKIRERPITKEKTDNRSDGKQ